MAKNKKRPVRWWDWPAVILLLVAVQFAAYRLVVTKWTSDLTLMQAVGFFGTLLGLALGYSIYSRKVATFFAIAYGVCLIPWQLGLTMEPEVAWLERLESLRGRLVVVLQELAQREAITDSILFLLLMSLVFWALSIYASFTLVRYAHSWRVVLPLGLTALIIHIFDPLLTSRSWYLAFILFFSLLLVARVVYIKHRATWIEQNTHMPPDVGFDLARFTLVVAFILVLFAWNVPIAVGQFRPAAKVWQTATNPWMNLYDRFSYAFASLKASVGLVSDVFGERLPLGLGVPLSEEEILEVEAPGHSPQELRYYWRARVYSVFENNEWKIGLTEENTQLFPSGDDLNQPGVEAREKISFTFYPLHAISTMYVAPQPVWISRPTKTAMVTNLDGTIDLESIQSQEYIKPGEKYEVRASLSAVTIKDLREAGTDYPQWVIDRYLQLPADITPRTYELAQRLAEGQETPYDITAAVTNYLRAHITYQQTIDAPPSGVNRIDWFLFETQKGFCYYYATSEIVLLRSLGIPARMAVGFAQGERQAESLITQPGGQVSPYAELDEIVKYVVRRNDAHAWPEVYFPGIGWVEFEPTTGQDPLYRPSGEDISNPAAGQPRPIVTPMTDDLMDPELSLPEDDLAQAEETPTGFWTVGNIIRLIVFILAIILIAWIAIKPRRRARAFSLFERLSQRSAIGLEKGFGRLGIKPPEFIVTWAFLAGLHPLKRAYQEINRSLKRLGREAKAQETPAERASLLKTMLPSAGDPTDRLVGEYQMATYSSHIPDTDAARQASNKIRELSYREILRRFVERLKHPRRRYTSYDI